MTPSRLTRSRMDSADLPEPAGGCAQPLDKTTKLRTMRKTLLLRWADIPIPPCLAVGNLHHRWEVRQGSCREAAPSQTRQAKARCNGGIEIRRCGSVTRMKHSRNGFGMDCSMTSERFSAADCPQLCEWGPGSPMVQGLQRGAALLRCTRAQHKQID